MNNKKEQLEKLKEDLESKAGKLPFIEKPTDVIFGEGNSDAKIMFIGEAGGFWEAKLRRPFVGNAGKLLDQLLSSVKLNRNEVYISNVVKARPPANRDPLSEEIEAFRPYLDKEIEIIQPKIIVTLGRFSMAKFIPEGKISQIHGQARFVEFNGRKYIVIPMFHPAAALRSLEVMDKIKGDFLKIPRFLGENINHDKTEIQEKSETQKEEQLSLLQ
jgi:DNA polymerase